MYNKGNNDSGTYAINLPSGTPLNVLCDLGEVNFIRVIIHIQTVCLAIITYWPYNSLLKPTWAPKSYTIQLKPTEVYFLRIGDGLTWLDCHSTTQIWPSWFSTQLGWLQAWIRVNRWWLLDGSRVTLPGLFKLRDKFTSCKLFMIIDHERQELWTPNWFERLDNE